MRGTPGLNQPKAEVSRAVPSLDKYFQAKNLRNQLILSRDIVDQRILQSDRMRITPCHNQPQKWSLQMLPSHDDYQNAKKSKVSTDFKDVDGHGILQFYWLRTFRAIIEETDFFQACSFRRIK